MEHRLNRREFFAVSAYAAAGLTLGLARRSSAADQTSAEGKFKHKLHKALIVEKPTEDLLKEVRDAGFEGVEAGILSRHDAAKIREVAERLGLQIHSVLRGWAKFNSNNTDEVESSLKTTIDAIGAAQAYGADGVLLVPGRIGGMPVPQPWEFSIEFDDKTGHLISVVEKNNERYSKYIAAHNHAYDTFRTAIRRLIPTAEKDGVVITVENVWNNMFIDPRHMANFVDSFDSPRVRAYFDIANHVKYTAPEQRIAVLGGRIVKCHVKDFKLNPDGRGGDFVNIRQGSVNWPVVRKALDEVGFNGWMTLEGSEGLSLTERSRRMDLIIAGK